MKEPNSILAGKKNRPSRADSSISSSRAPPPSLSRAFAGHSECGILPHQLLTRSALRFPHKRNRRSSALSTAAARWEATSFLARPARPSGAPYKMIRDGSERPIPPSLSHRCQSHGGVFATRQCTHSSLCASATLRNRLGGNHGCSCRPEGMFLASRLLPLGCRGRILGKRKKPSCDIAQRAPQSTRYPQLAPRVRRVPHSVALSWAVVCFRWLPYSGTARNGERALTVSEQTANGSRQQTNGISRSEDQDQAYPVAICQARIRTAMRTTMPSGRRANTPPRNRQNQPFPVYLGCYHR